MKRAQATVAIDFPYVSEGALEYARPADTPFAPAAVAKSAPVGTDRDAGTECVGGSSPCGQTRNRFGWRDLDCWRPHIGWIHTVYE